jgi:DNA-directed RNA polymerase subunit N (RpoN/RPB10)
MDYEAQLKCKRPQCEGVLTIPIKIVLKRDVAVILSRCYKCRTKYKVLFSMLEKEQWLSLLRDLFNRCEICGMVIPHDWNIYSASISPGFSSLLLHRNLGLANSCPNCKSNSPKAIDDFIWSLIKPHDEPTGKFPAPPPPTQKLFCTACGASLLPGSSFCSACGAKV